MIIVAKIVPGQYIGDWFITQSRNPYTAFLVGGDWNMTFIFPYIGNFIIPIDEVIFFRGVGIPPTSLESDCGSVFDTF